MDFLALAQQCAPAVSPHTMAAIVSVESSFNPYAIGVVKGRLDRQPRNRVEALQAVNRLIVQKKNFSMGIAQVNRYNLPAYKLSYEQAFDPCHSLRVGSLILKDCFTRALKVSGNDQEALRKALSCYYSGNFRRGFIPDRAGDKSYVNKVILSAENQARQGVKKQIVVPAIATSSNPAALPLKTSKQTDNQMVKPSFSDESNFASAEESTVKPRLVKPAYMVF